MQKYNGVKSILVQFQKKLCEKQHFYDSMRILNSNFSPLSEDSCRRELARCWIYGTDDIATLLRAPLPKTFRQTKISNSLASTHYSNWQTALEKNANPDSQYKEYFLNEEEFADYHLDKPKQEETLYNYVLRLRDCVENKKKIHFLWERGLSSFLHYLRQAIPKQKIAFLELIFPEEMEIRKITKLKSVKIGSSTLEFKKVPFGQIARKISPCVPPVYIITAADILLELAQLVIDGRQNAKLTTAEGLGLCWICLTGSRLQLPIELKDLLKLPINALARSSETNLPFLSIPTIFGWQPVPISETIWEFLKAISEIPDGLPRFKIFQSPKESLYRSLRRIIKKLDVDSVKRRITFKTFLSQPVEFDQSYQQK